MTTYVAFHDANYAHGYGVIDGASAVSSAITESASNQQSAAGTKPFVTVTATVAIFVAIGANPDATTAANRIYQPANASRTYGVAGGHKVAVVTA
jgi:uncharacterized membrane protein